MKLVDAHWDTDTLGVPTIELTLDDEDTPESVLSKIKSIISNDKVYCVIKIPAGIYDRYISISESGFVFDECQLCMRIGKNEFFRVQNRLGKYFSPRRYRVINSGNAGNLLKELDNQIFTTDRIARNPHFGMKLANQRYKKWIISCLDNPAYRITESYIGKEASGFGMDKLNFPEVIGILGANYPGFEQKASYINGMYDSTSEYFSKGFTSFRTYVSSNNMQIIKVLQALGFTFAETKYIFSYTRV